jgi:WD40 repeat protein
MPSIQPFPFGAFVVGASFIGAKALFALGDGSVRIVDGPAAAEHRAHAGAILAATPSLDGKSLITGGDDGRVVATGADGTTTALAERPRKWIDPVAAGPSGAVAFAAGKQAIVRLADGTERVFDHDRAVTGLAFAPKGLRIAVSHYNGVTLRWVNTDAPPAFLEWKGAHTGVTFSPDGRYVVSTMQENALHGWRLGESQHLRMTGYPAKPKSYSWSAKGRFLATSGAEVAVLWPFHFKDGPQGKPPLQLAPGPTMTVRVACHPQEEMLAIGYQDGTVVAARFSGEVAPLRPAGDGPVSALAWDGKGLRLAFGTEGGAAGIVDLAG